MTCVFDQASDRERESEHGEGNLAFRAGLATSQTQLGEALDFVRHNYRQVGYLMPDSLAPTASESITALAKRHAKIIGTISLWRDGPAGLQADEIYGDELGRMRARGARLGELGRLAMDSRTPPVTLLLSLFDKVAKAGHAQWHITDFVVECNPRHSGFYRRMFGFTAIGGNRDCNQVGAPAVLLHAAAHHLLHIPQQFGLVGRARGPRTSPLSTPVPEVLASPASTGPSLSERYNNLTKQLRDSLQKATRTP